MLNLLDTNLIIKLFYITLINLLNELFPTFNTTFAIPKNDSGKLIIKLFSE